MKQTSFATIVAVLWCIATLPAQRTPEPTAQPAHNVFVLTGCLERGNAPSAYRLTNAAPIGQAPPRVTTSAKGEADVYDLQATTAVSEQGFSNEKLQPEVGTQVEVTIRPVEAALPTPATPAATNAAEKPAETPRQRYTVIKLERRAGSCK